MKGTIGTEAAGVAWIFTPFSGGDELIPAFRGKGMLIIPLRRTDGTGYFRVGTDEDGRRTVEGEGWIVNIGKAEELAERLIGPSPAIPEYIDDRREQ